MSTGKLNAGGDSARDYTVASHPGGGGGGGGRNTPSHFMLLRPGKVLCSIAEYFYELCRILARP